MKKLSTEIIRKNGEIKTITVEVDDIYADWLLTQPKEVYHDAVLFEYRTSCVERKETRYIQSLDASMDNGFDFVDEDEDVFLNALKNITKAKVRAAIETLEPQQKWIVIEIYFKGRKQIEIANELGIGESGVRSRLKKIFEKLKKILI